MFLLEVEPFYSREGVPVGSYAAQPDLTDQFFENLDLVL